MASVLFLANGIRHLVSMLHVAGFSTVASLHAVASLLTQAFLLFLASLPWWRSCCCFHSCCCLFTGVTDGVCVTAVAGIPVLMLGGGGGPLIFMHNYQWNITKFQSGAKRNSHSCVPLSWRENIVHVEFGIRRTGKKWVLKTRQIFLRQVFAHFLCFCSRDFFTRNNQLWWDLRVSAYNINILYLMRTDLASSYGKVIAEPLSANHT